MANPTSSYPPAPVSGDPHAQVRVYLEQADALSEGIRGLTTEQLGAFPVLNTWSIQQIVVHLMDADLVASDRMKRIIAEENPSLIGFEENAWVRELHYEKTEPVKAAAMFALNRQLMAPILMALPVNAFSRRGTHNQRGPVSLLQMLDFAVWHLTHHLSFLTKKRDMLVNGQNV